MLHVRRLLRSCSPTTAGSACSGRSDSRRFRPRVRRAFRRVPINTFDLVQAVAPASRVDVALDVGELNVGLVGADENVLLAAQPPTKHTSRTPAAPRESHRPADSAAGWRGVSPPGTPPPARRTVARGDAARGRRDSITPNSTSTETLIRLNVDNAPRDRDRRRPAHARLLVVFEQKVIAARKVWPTSARPIKVSAKFRPGVTTCRPCPRA